MKISKTFGTLSTVFLSQFVALKAYAADVDPLSLLDPLNPMKTDLNTFITNAINFAITLAALVCVAILIASGYMYITASGDEAKVEKATKSMTGAIIGLVICFIAVILVQFVLKNLLDQK